MKKSHTELNAWLRSKALLPESIVHEAIENLLVDSSLWSKVDWSKEDEGNNEDTCTSNLIKPLPTAAFGGFTGCSFRCHLWSSCLRFGEFKTVVALKRDMECCFPKLATMAKKVVDGLHRSGYPARVAFVHGRGMDIHMYSLQLRSEALYDLKKIGFFRLVSSPDEFALLQGIGPFALAKNSRRSNMLALR
ncbi:MAG: hypothetical protein BYD32DRAFT_455712 [Podila humilis]|nr:MAG: hypothetical protein BYD32DRAFT_455712 [Podila humilis]